MKDLEQSLVLALDELPMPAAIHQDDIIRYANRAAHETMGYGDKFGAGVGMNIMTFQPPEQHDKLHAHRDWMFQSDKTVRNVPAVVVDRHGQRWLTLAAGRPVLWAGKPALLVAYTVLGLIDPPVHEAGKVTSQAYVDQPDGLAAKALAGLSTRERAVALMVCQGYSTINISSMLDINENTVRTHIRNISRKTQTHSRIELTQAMTGLMPAPLAREKGKSKK